VIDEVQSRVVNPKAFGTILKRSLVSITLIILLKSYMGIFIDIQCLLNDLLLLFSIVSSERRNKC
jgi:hypothetical protein